MLADLKLSNFSHTIRSFQLSNFSQNLSISNPSRSSSLKFFSAQSQREPDSPAQGPETPDYPDTPALRPDTPDIWILLYIPRGGSGKTVPFTLFSTAAAPSSLYSPTHALGAISTFRPSRTRQSLKEGSPPLRKLRGVIGFEVPALSTVSKVLLNFGSPDLPMS